VKLDAHDFERLRFTLGAFDDLSVHAVEAREFSSAARSILYLLLGAVAVPRGVLLACDAEGRIYPVATKPARKAAGAAWQAGCSSGPRETVLLARLPSVIAAGDARLPAGLRAALEEEGLSFVLPLVVRRRLAGLLALGQRLSGGPLGVHERATLETLGRYAGVLLHQHQLTQELRRAVDENLRLCESLADTYFETVRAFSAAIDAKDVYTRGHSLRVARYSAAIAARLALPRKCIAGIRIGAYLHDIGKLVVDRSLLNKPSSLSAQERREVFAHPLVGFEVLSSVSFPWPEVRDVVRSHHERMDGRGYPDGLHGKEIPMPARLLAVADAFDAMTSKRPYRQPIPVEKALGELVECCGTQFDAGLVRAFLEQCREELGNGGRDHGDGGGQKPAARVPGLPSRLKKCGVRPSLIDRLLQTLGPVPQPQFA
jgi:putative nucleotidyltransferase with HDIG domain